jgi:hypothetical protein
MQYDHLQFYSHGSSSSSSAPLSFMIGGTGLAQLGGGAIIAGRASDAPQREKSAVEKHIEIVEYLKKLPETAWVSTLRS